MPLRSSRVYPIAAQCFLRVFNNLFSSCSERLALIITGYIFFLAIYLSINSVQERSTKYNGTKIILWGTKNKKISRVFCFPTQDFNISNDPKWCDGVHLASLIVASISSILAGA